MGCLLSLGQVYPSEYTQNPSEFVSTHFPSTSAKWIKSVVRDNNPTTKITNFAEIEKLFLDGSPMNNGNYIFERGSGRGKCQVGPKLTGGVHSLTIQNCQSTSFSIGVQSYVTDPDEDEEDDSTQLPVYFAIGFNEMVSQTHRSGCIHMTGYTSPVGTWTTVDDEDTITVELDLRSEAAKDHTVRFFINDKPCQHCFHDIPSNVAFFIQLDGEGKRPLQFGSFEERSAPSVPDQILQEESYRSVVPAKDDYVLAKQVTPTESIKSLSALPLVKPGTATIEGNVFVAEPAKLAIYSSAYINKPLTSGIHVFKFKPGDQFCGRVSFAIAPSSYIADDNWHIAFEPYTDYFSVVAHLGNGWLSTRDEGRVDFEPPLRPDDEVTIEIDLRGTTDAERTIHFFVNDAQRPEYIFGLPESVHLGCSWSICRDGSIFQFISLSTVSEPIHQPKEYEKPIRF